MKVKSCGRGYVIVAVATHLVLSSSSAEYGGRSGSAAGTGALESLLRSGASAFSTSGGGNSREAIIRRLEESLTKVQNGLERTQEENELTDKVAFWRDRLDHLKFLRAVPDLMVQSTLRRREQESKELQALFAGLSRNAQISGSDLNMNGAEQSCSTGVDFSRAKQLMAMTASEPAKYFRTEAGRILEEQDKKDQEAKLGNLKSMYDNYIKALDSGEIPIEDPQPGKVQDDFTRDKRIAALKQTLKNQKEDAKDGEKSLAKAFLVELPTQLAKLPPNDKRMSEVTNFFADNLQQYTQAFLDATLDGVATLKKTCDTQAVALGRDNPMASGTLLGSAYKWVVGMLSRGDENYYSSRVFRQRAEEISGNLRCTDVSGSVEDLFQPVQSALTGLRGAKDPRTALQGAMAALDTVVAAQSQVGSMIRPLVRDCNYAAANVRFVQQFIGDIRNRSGQGGQSAATASAGSTGNTSQNNSRSVADRSRGVNPYIHSPGSRAIR